MYRQIHRSDYAYIDTCSYFSLCTEFHITRMQTKFYQSCQRHIKGSAALVQTLDIKTISVQRIEPRYRHCQTYCTAVILFELLYPEY